MQYCQKNDPAAKRATQQPNNVIHLEQGLLPPTIETQFDFKRLPIPEEKAHRKIVLKGTLKEDGRVADLQIFQGVLPQMDEAARLALSQWKFKPAMRNGKPISVEILVGIPAVVSE
jgi:TonB family protein